ncbi:MAG: class I adenylate-forming enzyme family protein [Aliishimia sp.]
MIESHYSNLFLQNVKKHPNKNAQICVGRPYSYAELKSLFDEFAKQFISAGWAGRRVAIYAASDPASVTAALAALHSGCTLVTIHHSYPLENLRQKLNRTDCTLLLADRSIEGVDLCLDGFCRLPGIDGDAQQIKLTTDEVGNAAHRVPNTACIFFTSGSTNEPKGVCVSDGNMVAAFEAVTQYMGNTERDVVLHYTALGLDYGFHNSMFSLLFGGTNVVGGVAPTDPNDILATIERHQVTGLQALPLQLFCLSQTTEFRSFDTRSLRYISSTGQALPINHIRNIRQNLPETSLFSMYGMTECKRILFLPPDQIDERPLSVGKPIPGVTTVLVHRTGPDITRAAKDEVAELAVVSEQVMQRYWQDETATEQVIRRNGLGHDKLFLTGDLFRQDAEGYLYHVSRVDDHFPRNTFMVNPREVEAAISHLPDVLECRVGPIPNEREGNVPCAYIVPHKNAEWTRLEEEVLAHCRHALDPHMVPSRVMMTDSLPRSVSGKLKTPEIEGVSS